MGSKPIRISRLRPRQAVSSGSAAAPTPTSPTSSEPSPTDTLASSQPSSGTTQPATRDTTIATTSDSSGSQNSATSGSPTSNTGSSTNADSSSSSTSPTDSSSSGSTSSPTSSSTSSSTGSSSTSSSQSTSNSASSSTSTSTSQSTSSNTPTSSTSSTTDSSSTTSPTSTTATSSASSSDSSSNSDSSSTSTSTTSNSNTSLTTITSSFVTTINGQATTVETTFPTTLNSAPANSSGQHMGVIAGSAIGATLFVLLLLTGLFLYYRRKARRKISLAHRALPAPRSALLADDDDFDLAGPSRSMDEGAPTLLRPRGQETGSVFHEGVWPPPGERSRLEDPLLAGSNIDLTSIVDSVMGGEGHQHERSSSASSSVPLLASTLPARNGKPAPPSAFMSLASQSAPRERSQLSRASEPWETTPLNPSGHAPQYSMDGSQGSGSPPDSAGLPPGAAPPKRGNTNPFMSVSGSLRTDTPHLRGGAGFGSLMVVNDTPDVEQETPLVDLTPSREEPPKEIPPLYHMIRRDTNDTWKSASAYSQDSAQNPQSPPAGESSGSGNGQTRVTSPSDVGQAL